MVVEHECVIFMQKLTAQPCEKEVTEGLLVNVDDARQIIWGGLADDSVAGCGVGRRFGAREGSRHRLSPSDWCEAGTRTGHSFEEGCRVSAGRHVGSGAGHLARTRSR